ncbi:CaiB/BaiF CoA transferase family protein [Haloplanus sp. GCM10025708]|uniref:CaiB/BaiF CoA transferase family protein n=1 Tax=Haloferacaceae TaxID=1644056 RepID=UPI00362417F3
MTGEAREPSGETGPLDGVTVLDASRVLAGPFCGMQLGDLGAEVVKVERPDTGDQTRGWTPPAYGDSEEAAYYLSINRNKRSFTLNLASEEGRDLFRELAAEADVLLNNFRVGKMEEWGLGYDELRAENPGLVYCSITGYGEWGPDKDRPAYDLVIQGESGIMSYTGDPDGDPVRVGVAIADLATGLYATQSVLAALLDRELGDGEGQKLDLSLLDSAVALDTYMAEAYFATGDSPGRQGGKHNNITPYQVFETQDGYAVVAVPSEHMWPDFCAALDREDLVDDERFATNSDRVEHRDVLDPMLEAEIAAYETDEIVALMQEYDVPATPINDMEDVFDHPQVRARGMRAKVDHPTAGTVEMPGVPMHFSRTPATVRSHPPLLGEHTDEILAELGYSRDEIERFHEDDVV